jgi:16S rRNA (cytosine967-C5)-methyltransferase
MVTQNCQRLGITNVRTVTYNEFDDCLASIPNIDAVLLDVPCSNSGVLARRLEVRMRITPEAVKELTKVQSSILQKAASVITPSAKICYSTCSICPHENENMIKNFLQNNVDFTLLLEELTLPTPISLNDDGSIANIDHDGGYVAILQKN